jgi:hypothetical protein
MRDRSWPTYCHDRLSGSDRVDLEMLSVTDDVNEAVDVIVWINEDA